MAYFKTRVFRDSTEGALQVERWDDGDVIFRMVGEDYLVCLSPDQLEDMAKFIRTGEE